MDAVEKKEREKEHPAVEHDIIKRGEKFVLNGGDVVGKLGDIAAGGVFFERAEIAGEDPTQQLLAHRAGNGRIDAGKKIASRPLEQKDRKENASAECQKGGDLRSGFCINQPLDDIGLIGREKRQRCGHKHKQRAELPFLGKIGFHDMTQSFLLIIPAKLSDVLPFMRLIPVRQRNSRDMFLARIPLMRLLRNCTGYMLGIRLQEILFKVRCGQRTAVIVSLSVVAGKLGHHLLVFPRFHSFGHSGDIQLFGQLQDTAHDLALYALCILGRSHQEQAVQL